MTRPYHFCAKNEYIDGQFLAGGCGNRQRQVAGGADVVFTDTHNLSHLFLILFLIVVTVNVNLFSVMVVENDRSRYRLSVYWR